ncbi:uncharacterized protein LOC135197266 [Macrobrachium nipponense]|uniref:uncharacterized protein LOC135197266 n=1 Tax=Macrobrachium nipponense TaxID=159736 RepID=UPI0030C8CFE3
MPNQSNLVLHVLILAFCVLFVLHYVIRHYEDITTWESSKCADECLERYFSGPPRTIKDPDVISLVKDRYLDPPPSDPDTTPYDIYRPVWRKLVDWYKVQENLREIWKDRAPGTFVEVGAADGEFMSQTLMLERNHGWEGLLIEPDPRSYKILRERKRNAWTTSLCVHLDLISSMKFWLRDLEEDLPEHFLQLLMARSKLETETLTGDEERGRTIRVKCMALTPILMAANMTSIDLLAVATGSDGDEVRVKDVLRSKVLDVKGLLIHFPTGRLFREPYPVIPGYILDMEHSTLMVKLYFKRKHCHLVSDKTCRKIHYFDVTEACKEYLCLGFLTVWTHQ